MFTQLPSIFINVVTPVFALVLFGYLSGPRLRLEVKTLSRIAYYLFLPAFVFDIISQAEVQVSLALQMVLYAFVVHIACAALGFGVAKLLRCSPEIVAGYVIVATFGNVGNFGLSLIEFRFGPTAIAPATVYFLAISFISFVICVGIASRTKSGNLTAVLAVFKTPAIIAFVPAILFTFTPLEVPLSLARISGLLGQAMIPTMLVTLGVQLGQMGGLKITRDTVAASLVRLVGGPILAFALLFPFGLTGVERGAGILQASMPAAVLATIIALEHDTAPEFVTPTVLFSTLASLVTLTILLTLV